MSIGHRLAGTAGAVPSSPLRRSATMQATRTAMAAPPAPAPAVGTRTVVTLALILLLVLALRLLLMTHSGAGLHVDEAQYWWWSRDLQWGYHSKPPGIAALIAASTALWGDSLIGIRGLAMACHPLAAACLWRLAHDIALEQTADPVRARRTGGWAAALFLCSPLSGLLGLVATTDAPLLLCGAAALLAAWHVVRGRGWTAVGALALAVGAGLLSKYTLAAWLPGALVWSAWAGGRRALARMALALAGALLVFSPHLVWNLTGDLATWQHTVASTVDVAPPAGRSPLRRVGELLAAQALLFGPAACAIALQGAGRAARLRRAAPLAQAREPATPGAPRRRLTVGGAGVLACGVPLLAAGLAMALRGRFEVNWIAPLHLLAALAVAPWVAAAGRTTRMRCAAALGLQALLVLALAALPALLQAWRPGQYPPPALDAWARMRGWAPALEALRPALRATGSVIGTGTGSRTLTTAGAGSGTGSPTGTVPGAGAAATALPAKADARRDTAPRVVVGSDRHVLAHAAWQWRDLRLQLAAADPDGRPEHHFERVCPWQRALRAGESAWLLSQDTVPARWARAFDHITPLARVTVPRSAGRQLTLTLARGDGFRPAAAVDDPGLLPAPDDARRCR